MKYDWIVNPNSNPNKITEKYNKIDSIIVDNNNNLIIEKGKEEIILEKPYSYQIFNNITDIVDVNYYIYGNSVRYEIGNYDKNEILIIWM